MTGRPRSPLLLGGLALALLLLAVPELTSAYWTRVLTATVVYAIAAAGLVILYGRVGMISLSQVALLGVGGWVTLRLGHGSGLPFPLLLLASGAVTAVVGVAFGLPALRISGLHLALVTLMAAGGFEVVFAATDFPNGGGGLLGRAAGFSGQAVLRRPALASTDPAYFRFAIVVALALFLLAHLHLRWRPGRAWAAIRQSEAAAVALGVNVTLYRLWAFALASFMTGVAGGLYAGSVRQLEFNQFRASASILLLAAALVGGVHSLLGGVMAGVFLQVLPAVLLTFGIQGDVLFILFGVGVVQTILTAPRGMAGQIEDAAAALGRVAARARVQWASRSRA